MSDFAKEMAAMFIEGYRAGVSTAETAIKARANRYRDRGDNEGIAMESACLLCLRDLLAIRPKEEVL